MSLPRVGTRSAPAQAGLKRALSELIVQLNTGATALNKEQQKADVALDKALRWGGDGPRSYGRSQR